MKVGRPKGEPNKKVRIYCKDLKEFQTLIPREKEEISANYWRRILSIIKKEIK